MAKPKSVILPDPVKAAFVALTELTDLALITPEAIAVGLGLMSCDVEIEMPLGTSSLADPIVKPMMVRSTFAFVPIQPLVIVRTIEVAVGGELVAAKPLPNDTVGVGVEAKKPLG